MYLAIDLGASKTLLAVFDGNGKLVFEHKIKTHKTYDLFLADIKKALATELKNYDFHAACCAIPGRVERGRGIGLALGNLDWRNVPVREDLKKLLGGIPVLVENDAKLAGLSEALAHKEYKVVLYITLSTGIGGGIIVNGKIDPVFADMEPGRILLEHDGKLQKWEAFASGKAFVARFGKPAAEIDDKRVWDEYVQDLAHGLDNLLAVVQPDVVIIGGGLGAHFEKFGALLGHELKIYQSKMVEIPPIIKAKRPEEAVIYGCYDFLRQNL